MPKLSSLAALVFFVFIQSHNCQSQHFVIYDQSTTATIVVDDADHPTVKLAAGLLARDIESVTGHKPLLKNSLAGVKGNVIIIGSSDRSTLIQHPAIREKIDTRGIEGKWETYRIQTVQKPLEDIAHALIICGSDPRGTAYGVFDISEKIGVSPWYWWADVTPVQQEHLYITADTRMEGPPSVKYRGIFLNDEDWGLQPWAALNIDKEVKDIGPNTYARIFELLLRLKANLIWPAMHPSTKAFFHYPGNPEKAREYSIVIGTSHAEPMLRNNVDEWDGKKMGSFDYTANRQTVHDYWEKRVIQAQDLEAIYTVGMRGVHDSGMKGVKDAAEASVLLEKIIADQRALLKKHINDSAQAVPQAFTAYKEVLDIYDQGMQIPEDITLVWPDDNYGYIRRLSNREEQQRPGGSGVYYHASYWGRPHDYLWLGTTHPALIREEMMKAHVMNGDQLWVLNVGDIKPLEYTTDLFLDMAWDTDTFQQSTDVKEHLEQWAGGIFGKEKAKTISGVLWKYYGLAFERRPEFMGWSRTEPTTQTQFTEYNHFYFGDEAQKRLEQYEALEQEVKTIRSQINAEDADAFYQLVYYPVVGASLMNKKFLYRDKCYHYTKQNRTSARDYAQWSMEAYEAIVEETNYYNNRLASGKWNGMMSMKPRDLPVYRVPGIPEIETANKDIWAVAPEGFVTEDSSLVTPGILTLPTFTPWGSQQYFVDLFLTNNKAVSWKASTSAQWIKLSESRGELTNNVGQKEQRLWIRVDWSKVPEGAKNRGIITLKGARELYKIEVKANKPSDPALTAFKGFVEHNGYVSIFAGNYSRKKDKEGNGWAVVEELGHSGDALMSLPLDVKPIGEKEVSVGGAPVVEYDFFTFTNAAPTVTVSTLPTHSVSSDYSLRYGISIDDGPVEIVDFRVFGRSEEWKQNVLQNRADREIKYQQINAGKHTLKIYQIDPGVILDRITIDLGGLKKAYSTIPETKMD